MALSTYLPLQASFKDNKSDANKKTDIFMAHGTMDDIVATKFGRTSFEILKDAGYAIHWHQYPMAHSVCPEEITDIGLWLTNRLS
jgi:phospholipase/carboxylesterase